VLVTTAFSGDGRCTDSRRDSGRVMPRASGKGLVMTCPRHCEEPFRRSNPVFPGRILDCFAARTTREDDGAVTKNQNGAA
jgi:hypothetical protein